MKTSSLGHRENDRVISVTPQPTTVIRLILKYLEQEGVKYIFGIPGGPLMPFYEALYDAQQERPETAITHILAKHEEGAAFMADGYARVSGQIGVCCATSGPGATNTITGIASAYADSIPVLLLTAQVATHTFGKGSLQESSSEGVDIVEMLKPITKFSVMLSHPNLAGEVIRKALRLALSGRPGPVHINIPVDLMQKPVEGVHAEAQVSGAYRSSSQALDPRRVDEAVEYLLSAQRPAMLIGNGVNHARAYEEVRALAEEWVIPVATTNKAKGAFPEHHNLALGVFGFAGTPLADRYLLSEKVDVLVVIGTGLGEVNTHAWDRRLLPSKALIQIDIDPHEMGKNYPVTVGLVGDAQGILQALLERLRYQARWLNQSQKMTPRLTMEEFLVIKRDFGMFLEPEKMTDEAVPLKPHRVMRELRQSLPDDAVVFCDMGSHTAWALHYFPCYRPRTFFHNFNFAAMGHGTASVVGGQLAAPEVPAVAIVGDACFTMNGMEVATAVNHHVPAIWVVLNDARLGLVHMGQKLQFREKYIASSVQRLDIVKIAEGLGARGFRVTRPGELIQLMPEALELKAPVVFDVYIDPDEIPPVGSRIKALNKFFEGK